MDLPLCMALVYTYLTDPGVAPFLPIIDKAALYPICTWELNPNDSKAVWASVVNNKEASSFIPTRTNYPSMYALISAIIYITSAAYVLVS